MNYLSLSLSLQNSNFVDETVFEQTKINCQSFNLTINGETINGETKPKFQHINCDKAGNVLDSTRENEMVEQLCPKQK